MENRQTPSNPQKNPAATNSLSTLSIDPHKKLKTLLAQVIQEPENPARRQSLADHLHQNGTIYLETPTVSRKTGNLLSDFVQHPTNQEPGKVHPTLQALHQFHQSYQQISQAARSSPHSNEPALRAGFHKLEQTVNSLASGTFGPQSTHTVQTATFSAVKAAHTITHKGVEAATMGKHFHPNNDKESQEIARAQKTIQQARVESERTLHKVLQTGKKTAEVAIQFVPGGQVVGVAKSLQVTTQTLLKTAKGIQETQQTAQTVSRAVSSNSGKPLTTNPRTGSQNESTSKAMQTAEKLANTAHQVKNGLKEMNQGTRQQQQHSRNLQEMPHSI